MASPLRKLLEYYQTKFRDKEFEVFGDAKLNPDNVQIWESKNLLKLDKINDYPRIEITIWKGNGKGYIGNASRKQSIVVQVAGFIYRGYANMESEDIFNAIDFIEEIEEVAYSANADRALNGCPFPGFEQVDGWPVFHVDDEIRQDITSSVYLFNVEMSKPR